MDHMSNDSWTTVSASSGKTATATTPLHQQQPQEGPIYPASRMPKNSDTSSESSGKHKFTGLELETGSSSSSSSWTDQSWMRRIRWFRNTRTRRDAAAYSRTDEIPYVGGRMDSPPPIPVRTVASADGGDRYMRVYGECEYGCIDGCWNDPATSCRSIL